MLLGEWQWVKQWVDRHHRTAEFVQVLDSRNSYGGGSVTARAVLLATLVVPALLLERLVPLLPGGWARAVGWYLHLAAALACCLFWWAFARQVRKALRPPPNAIVADMGGHLANLAELMEAATTDVSELGRRANELEIRNRELAGQNTELRALAQAAESPEAMRALNRKLRREGRRAAQWSFAQGAFWFLAGVVLTLLLQGRGG